MKLWQVHQGCIHEGGSTVGLFETKEEAIAEIERYVVLEGMQNNSIFDHTWTRESELKWERYSDVIIIEPIEVGYLSGPYSRWHYFQLDLVTTPLDGYKAHACNALGKWGRGIAASFRDHYPVSYKEYQDYCTQNNTLGTAFVTSEKVVCLITSHGYSPPDAETDIINNTRLALEDLAKKMPLDSTIFSNRFNSGLFGVEWHKSFNEVEKFLAKNTKIHWVVCDPPEKE